MVDDSIRRITEDGADIAGILLPEDKRGAIDAVVSFPTNGEVGFGILNVDGLWRLTAHKISEIFGVRLTKKLRGKLSTVIEEIEHGHHVISYGVLLPLDRSLLMGDLTLSCLAVI